MNTETFRQNKKKRKILKLKQFFSRTLSNQFPQIVQKFHTVYLFFVSFI